MLMNMKSNSKVGKAITETASIAYTGELLPAGTASYGGISIDATKRYLKNSGKDKTPALVESGQGKFFNGSNQYINTGVIPNKAQGTLVTRFTYASGTDKLVIGQSGGTANFMVGVNTSGKLYARLGATSNIATSWSPIAGKSYHLAIRYMGGVAELIVDTVSIGTFTIDASIPTVALSIGARNTSTTASLFWNSVIDETYYYDIALTDAQISTLYQYPEKIKAYNDAIVPDIGYEANCKLFLPMCENSGSNVVNVAVARSSAINITLENPLSATYIGGILTPTASTAGRLEIRPAMTNIVVGDFIEFNINMVAVNANTRLTLATNAGGFTIVSTAAAIVGNNTVIGQIPAGSTVVHCLVYADSVAGTAPCTIGTYTVKEITAYPIASYTTAMHTSAAKLSYGAQCTAWKRDSLGVLLGISNGLSFNGGVSVKGVSTGITLPNTSTWAAEAIVYIDGIATSGYLKAMYGGSGNFLNIQRTSLTTNAVDISCMARAYSTTLATGWHHIAVDAIGKFYIDGVLVSTQTPLFTGTPSVVYVGSDSILTSNLKNIVGAPKIHKGTQYAKFNIDKSWKAAQKIIAKLGA